MASIARPSRARAPSLRRTAAASQTTAALARAPAAGAAAAPAGARLVRIPTHHRLGSSATAPGRSARVAAARAAAVVCASGTVADVAEEIVAGLREYQSGERMAALKRFEKTYQSDNGNLDQRRDLCYLCACCYAAFGDIELAQIYLREAIELGLDYSEEQSNPRLMRMEVSAQMR